jgi:hypothetical protein
MSFADSQFLEISCRTRLPQFIASGVIAICVLTPWMLSSLDLTLKCSLTISALGIGAALCRREGLIGNPRLVAAALQSEGEWQLTEAGGRRMAGTLDAQSRVLPMLVFLRWRTEFGARQVILCGRSVRSDPMRRLSVRLRLGRLQGDEFDGRRKGTLDPADRPAS